MTIDTANLPFERYEDRQKVLRRAEAARAQEMRNLIGGLSRRVRNALSGGASSAATPAA